jgi:hypothetical protein
LEACHKGVTDEFVTRAASGPVPEAVASLHLQRARADGIVDHGFVVHMGKRSYPAADGVDVVAAEQLLSWEQHGPGT